MKKTILAYLVLAVVVLLIYTKVIQLAIKQVDTLNIIIVSCGLIFLIFGIGDQIAQKTNIEPIGRLSVRLFMMVVGTLIVGWASVQKDRVTSEEAATQVTNTQNYYSSIIDKIVEHNTDSILSAKMATLYTNLAKLIGSQTAKQVINNSFEFTPPSLTFVRPEITTLYGSTQLKPIFVYHIRNVGGPAYNVNISQTVIAETKGVIGPVGRSTPEFRIPRGHDIGQNIIFNYSDTIESQSQRDIYYFLFKGTYEDALHNNYTFQSVLQYDMGSNQSGTVTSPKQEQILATFAVISSIPRR
jgi:hypothetical protein